MSNHQTVPRIWVDTDLGVDDVLTLLALAALAKAGKIELAGISLVGGSHTVDEGCVIIPRLLHYFGIADVPVFKGKDNENIFATCKERPTDNFHGAKGTIGNVAFPKCEPDYEIEDLSKDAVSRIANAPGKEKLTVLAIGPLSNIVEYFDPECVKSLHVMAGAFNFHRGTRKAAGNVRKGAEFNITIDAPAAQKVFQTFKNIVLIPLDVTHQTLSHVNFRRAFYGSLGLSGRLISKMLNYHAKHYPEFKGKSPMHDVHVVLTSMFGVDGHYDFKSGNIEIEIFETNDPNHKTRHGKTIFTAADHGNVKVPNNMHYHAKKRLEGLLLKSARVIFEPS